VNRPLLYVLLFSPITLLAQPATRPDTVRTRNLEEVRVEARRPGAAVGRVDDVSGTGIYAGRRSEVVKLDPVTANLATNNARQILARVPGLNIVENDNTGVQLGVAVRGLNPSRIQEFNARQNGYDIAADPLGYPESYYTPPTEALERIEVVRGAASLQYGPQFGGLLHFVLKRPETDRRLAVQVRQTVGAFGLSNTFARVGGTSGRLSYTGFGLYKRTDGWRANNGVQQGTGYGLVKWQASENLALSAEVTAMRYEYQQPGGRTDEEFRTDPRGSARARNWFQATWLLPALVADWRLSDRTSVNVRAFGLVASRLSLGNLASVYSPDTVAVRNLLEDQYRNLGAEARLRHDYPLGSYLSGTAVVGARVFRGQTTRRQGDGPTGSAADFRFQHPDQLENFDFRFPSTNVAFFAENLFRVGPRLTVTPGVRVEYIRTESAGYYRTTATGPRLDDGRVNARSFPLLGLSTGYQLTEHTDAYASFAQNYAAVNFNDLRVANPNFTVDPNLKDSRGYSAEIGYRGTAGPSDWLKFDLGAFYLSYQDRIGTLNGNRRTNIADSRSVGVEAYGEIAPLRLAGLANRFGDVSLFTSYGFTDAQYVRAEQAALRNKVVELAPRHVLRGGVSYRRKGFGGSIQAAHTSEQFADATNARFATESFPYVGLIPAYTVFDLSASYAFAKYVTVSSGITNLTDARYFTRRATGYPGPGILPSDGRAWYVSLEVRL
jgi:Fe(3+) dicitrate transport protein